MIGSLLLPEIEELIAARDFVKLREILAEFPPADVAEILADLQATDTALLLRVLPREFAAEVFEHLSPAGKERLVRALGDADVAKILNELPADTRTELLEELPAPVVHKLLALLSPDQRRIASELLGYPKDSVGRRMTPAFVAIDRDWTVGQVLAHLRAVGTDREALTLNQLYVVDGAGRLVDWVRLERVAISQEATPVSQLLEGHDLSLKATDTEESAVAAFQHHGMSVLPVTDARGTLLGLVTVDDVLDVAEQVNTEDIQKMGGMEVLDAPYLRIGFWQMVRKRAGWLAILFFGEMLTATAMGYFEGEIAKVVVLASFIPLIISSGGNSGSQATSLMIRSLAVGDVKSSDWWRVLSRECFAGLALGLTLALLGFARIWIWQIAGFKDYGDNHALIALTVGLSLVGVVLFGTLAGAMLPFLLRRIKMDPAVASAPLVATLVDVTGLVIYFSIAYQVLRKYLS
jgi:magnesium transporter